MELRRRTDEYAAHQVRTLLLDLKNQSHGGRVKGIEKFKSYIENYRPEILDDTVAFLYTGSINPSTTPGFGLLYWSGVESEKHHGQLKRICGNVVSLIRWLASEKNEPIYLEVLVQVPLSELKKINFAKHILREENGLRQAIAGSKLEHDDDIYQLIYIILENYQPTDEQVGALSEQDDFSASTLLDGDELCLEKLREWEIRTQSAIINSTDMKKAKRAEEKRPQIWTEVNFKCVPPQTGEDDDLVDADNDADESEKPVSDPLGLTSNDLRDIQNLHMSHTQPMMSRKSSLWNMPVSLSTRATISPRVGGSILTAGDEDDDADDVEYAGFNKRQSGNTIIPSDKSFSTSKFLLLVHGSVSFEQLQQGLRRLEDYLRTQSSRREKLVRDHYALFVQCAEGLEWLKAYKKGVYIPKKQKSLKHIVATAAKEKRVSLGAQQHQTHSSMGSISSINSLFSDASKSPEQKTSVEKGEAKLLKAKQTLDDAKVEAQRTLAPILERMKNSRKIKNAEKVLKRMAHLLESPYKMRLALNRGDLSDVVAIYQRIQSMPASSVLRILVRVKDAADDVIADLKVLCMDVLLKPNTDYTTLLKYGKLILDLDGPVAYANVLKRCLLRHIAHVITTVRLLKDKFAHEVMEAYKNGQDLNTIRQNSIVREVGLDGVYEAENALAMRRQINSSRRGPNQFHSFSKDDSYGSVVESESVNSDGVPKRQPEKDDFDINDDETDDEMLDLEGLLEDDDSAYYGIEEKRHQLSGKVRGRVSDHSDLLCANVRQTYVETLVDIIATWFPCLHRLVTELSVYQSKEFGNTEARKKTVTMFNSPFTQPSSADQADGAQDNKPRLLPPDLKNALNNALKQRQKGIFASNSGSNTASMDLGSASSSIARRGGGMPLAPPNKLLAGLLSFVGDSIQELVNGLSSNFITHAVSPELTIALDMDKFENGDFSHDYMSDNSPPVSAENPIFSQPVLNGMLREPFLRNSLAEIYDLYEAMESIIKNEDNKSENKQQQQKLHGKPSIQPRAFDSEFFIPAGNPYFEPLNLFHNLAKQGELSLADRVMVRLQELCTSVCNFGPRFDEGGSSSNPIANTNGSHTSDHDRNRRSSSTGSFSTSLNAANDGLGFDESSVIGRGDDRGSSDKQKKARLVGNRVDRSLQEFEDLLLRCVKKLNSIIKRPQWVAVLVQEGIASAIQTYADFLRREIILIEDFSSQLLSMSGSSYVVGRQSIKRETVKSRALAGERGQMGMGMEYNSLMLKFLDEELRGSVETVGSSDQKSMLSLLLLKSCIFLRAESVFMLWDALHKQFLRESTASLAPNSASLFTTAATNSSSGGASGTGLTAAQTSSLLNRLFTSEQSSTTTTNSVIKSSSSAAINKAAAATDIRGTTRNGKNEHSLSLSDRLLDSCLTARGQHNAIHSNSNSNSNSNSGNIASEYCKKNVLDIIPLEVQVVNAYLDQKIATLRSVIAAGFSLILNGQSSSSSSLSLAAVSGGVPTHVSRILFALGNEKIFLRNHFGNATVEQGFKKRWTNGNVREVFSGYGAERSDYDPDDDDNYYSPHGTSSHYHPGGQTDAFNRFPSSSSPSGLTGQRYSEYLFQELCGRLLDTYSEMIRSLTLQQQQLLLLSQNQTQTQTQTQQPVQPKRPQLQANPSPPISKQYQQNINDALAQALAEYEYFKYVMRSFMVSSAHFQLKKADTAVPRAVDAIKEMLIKNSATFAILITN